MFSRKCFILICQQAHKSHWNYHRITVRLLFIHETIGYVHQTRSRQGKCIQPSVSHALSDYHNVMVSGHLGAMSRIDVLLHQASIFLGNMCAKYYENPIMLSKVTAKNVGDVFLRHTVYASCKFNKTISLMPCAKILSSKQHKKIFSMGSHQI